MPPDYSTVQARIVSAEKLAAEGFNPSVTTRSVVCEALKTPNCPQLSQHQSRRLLLPCTRLNFCAHLLGPVRLGEAIYATVRQAVGLEHSDSEAVGS